MSDKPKVVTIDDNGIARPYSLHLSRSNGDSVVWKANGSKNWRVKFGKRSPFGSDAFEVRPNNQSQEGVPQGTVAPGGYDYIVEPADSEGGGIDPRIEIVP